MNYSLAFLPEAEAEMAEAYRWYNQQRAGLGEEFALSLEASIAVIRRTPLLYPIVKGEFRRAVLRRFPFIVLYVVRGERISVLAVFHTSRNPQRWVKRMRWRD